MFDVSKVSIFSPERAKQVTRERQSHAIAVRIAPHVKDKLPTVEQVKAAVHAVLPRFQASGWTENRYLDTLCIWEIQFGPNFEAAPEFARVPRFYVRAHETQHDVFAFIMVTLRAAEVT